MLFLSIVQKATKILTLIFCINTSQCDSQLAVLIYWQKVKTVCWMNFHGVLLCKFWPVIRVDPASPAAGHAVAILGAVEAAGPSYFSHSTNRNSAALSFNGLSFLICSFTSFHRERNVFFLNTRGRCASARKCVVVALYHHCIS